jgi:hypothetical protein
MKLIAKPVGSEQYLSTKAGNWAKLGSKTSAGLRSHHRTISAASGIKLQENTNMS